MNLAELSNEVSNLFKNLDDDINDFKIKSGIDCPNNCGYCCYNPDIYATIIEFLPMAFKLYENNKIDITFKKSESSSKCVFFERNESKKFTGRCLEYSERGLICRAFGFISTTDKNNNRIFIPCKIMKENLSDKIININKMLLNPDYNIPSITYYSNRLMDIDFELSKKIFPINTAVKIAIEKVLLYKKYSGND